MTILEGIGPIVVILVAPTLVILTVLAIGLVINEFLRLVLWIHGRLR